MIWQYLIYSKRNKYKHLIYSMIFSITLLVEMSISDIGYIEIEEMDNEARESYAALSSLIYILVV